MGSVIQRRHYIVTSFLSDWVHTENESVYYTSACIWLFDVPQPFILQWCYTTARACFDIGYPLVPFWSPENRRWCSFCYSLGKWHITSLINVKWNNEHFICMWPHWLCKLTQKWQLGAIKHICQGKRYCKLGYDGFLCHGGALVQSKLFKNETQINIVPGITQFHKSKLTTITGILNI